MLPRAGNAVAFGGSGGSAERAVGLGVQGAPGEGAEGRTGGKSQSGLCLCSSTSDPAPFLGLRVFRGCLRCRDRACGAGLGRAPGVTGCSRLLPTVTPPDCYVTLWLPTASSQRLQTRTVNNSRNPIWNQSFRFRIHRQLKVGLE